MLPKTIEWLPEERTLRLLDQRRIPGELRFRDCKTYEDAALAIEDMTVRGAPAIGVAAAYGAAIAAYNAPEQLEAALDRLSKTRPTAVHLYWALSRMRSVLEKNKDENNLAELLEREANEIYREDIDINRRLSNHGQTLLPTNAAVITHCNAGALATAGYGTALGVFRAAAENGKKLKIYADETRPRFQGGRITSYELYEDGLDVTVICDSMAAFLMSKRRIDAVITGADRVALNGDTANKIGTYNLAIAAKYHNVPFYIAAPLSTIDTNCLTGADIPIEERSPDEVRVIGGAQVIPERIPVWNPAFDVTPSELIAGIITEVGILKRPYDMDINKIFNDGKHTAVGGN